MFFETLALVVVGKKLFDITCKTVGMLADRKRNRIYSQLVWGLREYPDVCFADKGSAQGRLYKTREDRKDGEFARFKMIANPQYASEATEDEDLRELMLLKEASNRYQTLEKYKTVQTTA